MEHKPASPVDWYELREELIEYVISLRRVEVHAQRLRDIWVPVFPAVFSPPFLYPHFAVSLVILGISFVNKDILTAGIAFAWAAVAYLFGYLPHYKDIPTPWTVQRHYEEYKAAQRELEEAYRDGQSLADKHGIRFVRPQTFVSLDGNHQYWPSDSAIEEIGSH